MIYKVCTECKESKLKTEEFFYKKRGTLEARCKLCKSKYHKNLYAKDLEESRKRCRDNYRKLTTIQKKKRLAYARSRRRSFPYIIKHYRANAKKRGFEFGLSSEVFNSLLNKPCFYCGSMATGVDRVNNSLGYIEGNCVTCCKICNRMKRDMTKEIFIRQCNFISKKSAEQINET